MVAPQGRSGRTRKISRPQGFDPRTVQPVTSLYTGHAIPADVTKSGKGECQNTQNFQSWNVFYLWIEFYYSYWNKSFLDQNMPSKETLSWSTDFLEKLIFTLIDHCLWSPNFHCHGPYFEINRFDLSIHCISLRFITCNIILSEHSTTNFTHLSSPLPFLHCIGVGRPRQ